MRSKKEVLQEHYGVETVTEVRKLILKDFREEWPLPLSQATKLKLPYEAPSHPDIPSIGEIDRAMVENKLTEPGHINHAFGNVCRIGKTVVKRGQETMVVREAEDLLFLQANSQIRTPKVYAVFSHLRDGDELPTNYLVMEYIEGETLDYLKWIALSEQDQAVICAKLAEQFRLLRSVPSEGYYGRVHHQSWHHRVGLIEARNKPGGPYDTYEDLISAMYSAAELTAATCTNTKEYSPQYESALSEFKSTLATCGGQRPTLTHLDPQLRNIIVRRLPDTEDHTPDWEVTLIDWEHMGWLPAYMQSVVINQHVNMCHGYDANQDEAEEFVQRLLSHFEEEFTEQIHLFEKMSSVIRYGIL